MLYDRDDPDACSENIPLTDDEAEALADLLGASVMLGRLTGLSETDGRAAHRADPVAADSPYVGRTARRHPGPHPHRASIVAVLRDGDVIPSPDPAFRFEAGDTWSSSARGRARRGRRDPRRRIRAADRACITTTVLLIEVGALLLALGLLGRLARRFGFSPIPLYLLAGLAFGHGGCCR